MVGLEGNKFFPVILFRQAALLFVCFVLPDIVIRLELPLPPLVALPAVTSGLAFLEDFAKVAAPILTSGKPLPTSHGVLTSLPPKYLAPRTQPRHCRS